MEKDLDGNPVGFLKAKESLASQVTTSYEELCRKGPERQQVARSQQCTQASQQPLQKRMDQRGVGRPARANAVQIWATCANQISALQNESSRESSPWPGHRAKKERLRALSVQRNGSRD